ncbi:MAG: chitobiase/beta-hexosaminidase C-terminal domain-containing protein [Chloroflexi bacterium]|nr:chitobiase/beta-hexosaminidase C-terminal domain-containing protein [Chloroflexota bacterium]
MLAKPTINPNGGTFDGPQQVAITHPDPGVKIRYTLDGTPANRRKLLYEGPITIDKSCTLRTRAFTDTEGSKQSVAKFEISAGVVYDRTVTGDVDGFVVPKGEKWKIGGTVIPRGNIVVKGDLVLRGGSQGG